MEAIKYIRGKIPGAAIVLVLFFAIGTPVHANVNINPASVNFGNQTIGISRAPVNMTLTNARRGKLTIVSISSSVPQFSYSWPSLPFTLNPGQQLTGTVAFTPAAPQIYNGTLTFTAAIGLNIVVSLSGTGVQAQLLATIQPASKTVTAGQTATFSASVSGATPVGYQWKKNGATINGATAAGYTTPPTTTSDNGAQFTATVSTSTGNASSNPATLTVNAAPVAPAITTQPASQTVTAGQAASFSVAASGTAPLGYQWKKNGTPIAGATSATYSTPATSTSDNEAPFTVVVGNTAGNVTSNAATLTVNAAPVAPAITTQPASQTVTAGQAASFSVAASGTAPLTYQWKKNGTPMAGATSATYSTPATSTSDNGAPFTVVVGNTAGNVTSNAATLTVNAAPVAPAITTQPASQTVTAGQAASFSVAASGTAPLSYQWKKSGASITGATAPTYSTPATSTSDNGAPFTVVVGNTAGNVTSNAATLTVNPAPVAPAITTQPASQTVTAGQAASFSVAASGTAPLSYQWKKSGTPIAGATSSTYTTPATTTSDTGSQFTATVSNAAGNVTSSAATLTVNAPPGQLTASASTLSFGNVNVGTSSSQSVTFINSGNANINISNVIFSGGTGFSVSGVPAGLILGSGQTATLNVTFAPGATGNVTGRVTLISNAANSPTAISISGAGLGNTSQNTTAVPNAFLGLSLFSSSLPLAGGIVMGTLGKTGGITGHWLEPTCDGGTDPNNPCYTWSGLTSYVNLAQSNGLTIVYDFSIPGWMCGAGSSVDCRQLPTNLTWLSNFATALATKYKGQIKYYETNNEVNNPTESWNDTCANLVLVHNMIYAAIKAVDPTAIVGAPNMAAYNGTITGVGACVSSPVAAGNSASIWLSNFLQTQDRNGNRPTVDTVGVHTYASQVATSLDGCDWSNNKLHCAAAPLLHLYNSFRTVMTNNGMTSVPLLVTEGGFEADNNSSVGAYGCSTNVNALTSCLNNAQQVAYVGRWLVLSASTWADGSGQLANWYAYDIDWSTLNGSNGMNPQNAWAYGQMETWIKGATFSQQCQTGSQSTVFVCDFVSGAGKPSEIIFNDNNGATVQYTPPAWAGSYQPLLGSTTPISAGTVTVGDTPILLQ